MRDEEVGRRARSEGEPPEGAAVVLYDGACPFCRAQLARLLWFVPAGAIEALDLDDPSVPARFPHLSRDSLLAAMHLVDARGRVFTGFQAVVRAVASRPLLGKIALLCCLPGIRQLAEWIYRVVAKRRYRQAAPDCPAGSCAVHAQRPSSSNEARMRR
jgi:predicted DCC family thiol-disulfide oxidoreductase YuxK